MLFCATFRNGRAVLCFALCCRACTCYDAPRFDVAFVSTAIQFNPEHLTNAYYSRYGDVDETSQAQLVAEAKRLGVSLSEAHVPLSRLLSAVTPHSIPIVLVDVPLVYNSWTTPPPRHSYVGHFLPVVGYDSTHVIVHDQVRASGWLDAPTTSCHVHAAHPHTD